MHKEIILFVIVAFLFATSCQQDIEPVVLAPEVASVNFYNAAEAKVFSRVVIDDDSVLAKTLLTFYNTEVPGNQIFGDAGTYNQSYREPAWLPVSAGRHRFAFNANAYFEVDTTLTLSKSSMTCFYLSESPESDTAYRITTVQEEWGNAAADPAKVKVRFVNLSPDAGTLSCYRSDNNTEVMPTLGYGTASTYVSLDTTGLAQNYNRIILQFISDKDPANILIKTAIPNIPGACFVAVLQGFNEPADRVYQSGINPDGSPKYTKVTIQPYLRINLRRIY